MRKILVSLLVLTLLMSLFAGLSSISFAQTRLTRFNEAPMLSELVKQGKLPPVEKRLPVPEDIYVLEPVEEIGTYGGTWRTIDLGPGMGFWNMVNAVEPLVRWNKVGNEYKGFKPGLAKRWVYSDDGKICTIYLRKGLKWSDGEPFTADDIMFWWNDLITNKDYGYELPPRWAWRAGKLMDVEKVNDYTVRFKFAAPYYTFHTAIAQGYWENVGYLTPKHYLKQFHPKYNPNVKDYQKLREKRTNITLNPDYPVLYAWRTVSWDASRGVLVAERNPYYWKVDTKGNQLPYIDRVVVTILQDSKLIPLKVIAGEIDAQFRPFELKDLSLLMENQEKGGYRVLRWAVGDGGATVFYVNWDIKDPKLRPIFRNQDFRIALSTAINRKRINQIVWGGLATPAQATMGKYLIHYRGVPWAKKFHEEWARSYAEYNPEKAKELLDKIGLKDINGDGWRELPDGSPLRLLIDVSATDLTAIDGLKLVTEDLKAIGLNVSLNTISPELWGSRAQSGEFHFQGWNTAGDIDLLNYPDNIFPIGNSRFHPLIGLWLQTGGKQGEPPEGPMKKLLDLYEKALGTRNEVERNKIILEACRIHITDGPFAIAACYDLPAIVIVKNNFRNVPNFGITGPWAIGEPGTSEPSQFFFKR